MISQLNISSQQAAVAAALGPYGQAALGRGGGAGYPGGAAAEMAVSEQLDFNLFATVDFDKDSQILNEPKWCLINFHGIKTFIVAATEKHKKRQSYVFLAEGSTGLFPCW